MATKTPWREDSSISRRGRSYPIWVLLVALSLPALIGASWFGIVESSAAGRSVSQSDSVQMSIERLVLLTEVRTRLLHEGNWDATARGIAEIGIDPGLVLTFTGVDLNRELETNQSRVDELLEQLDLPEIRRAVDGIRADDATQAARRGAQYAALENSLKAEADTLFDDALRTVGEMDSENGLTDALRVFEEAAEAHQSIAREFTLYFGAQFASLTDAGADTELLISSRANRITSLDEIDRIAAPTSAVRSVLEQMAESQATQTFDGAIDDFVAQTLETGAGENEGLAAVLGQLDSIAPIFTSSLESTDVYFSLLTVAADDVSLASAEMNQSAAARYRTILLSSIALVVMSLFFVAVAQRAITQPSRRLAAAASRIRNGDFTANEEENGGPREIRVANNAIREAAFSLDLAQRQAQALAEGDLDHVSLTEPTRGSLGASLQTAVRTLATSLQLKDKFQHELEFEAAHDGLTQVANRRESLAQLEAHLRSPETDTVTAVLFVDLDNFKSVNDAFGHQTGDEILRLVADRLHATTGTDSFVGRLGGDEFVILAETHDLDDAVGLGRTVLDSLADPYDHGLGSVHIGASIGVAIGQPGDKPAEVLKRADLALYRAKSSPDCQIQPFDEALRAELEARSELACDLERALGNADQEFVLHHQPIVKPHGDSVCTVEVLLRWNRPGYGLVFPDSFIPFAEESDLILSIDQWVLKAAVAQIPYLEPGQKMSVNMSSRHLTSPTFVDDVLAVVHGKALEGRLILEVTESAFVENLEDAAEKLQALRDHGLLIAIDDFGTGFTSLAELRTLPMDILKIDRSFVNDESAAALVQLLIDTGHHLGANVVAEGIETEEEMIRLRNMGADALQGYYFARPAEPDFGSDFGSGFAAAA
ncbi:MAG: EAL domain-containing protein [Acidimicrobiales bacterium]|nr:EAL domain-containing protein [Acidimicrobiales bacterium]